MSMLLLSLPPKIAATALPSRFRRFPPLPHFLQFYDLGASGIKSLRSLLLPHLFIKPRCGNRSIIGRNRSVIEGEVVVELALALANTLSRPIDWAQKYLGSELANRVTGNLAP